MTEDFETVEKQLSNYDLWTIGLGVARASFDPQGQDSDDEDSEDPDYPPPRTRLEPPELKGKLTITVTDKLTGDPIADARVRIAKSFRGSGEGGVGMTDESGMATFREVPSGGYFYDIWARGYAGCKGSLKVEAETETRETATLAQDTLKATVIISVTDEVTGANIKGAAIKVGKMIKEATDGTAWFPLPPGTYSYGVVAKGYEHRKDSFDVNDEGDTQISCSLKPKGGGMRGVLGVVVSDKSSGYPIDNAEVTVGEQTLATVPLSAGSVTFVGLTPGKQPYRISAAGYKDVTGTVMILDDDNKPNPPLNVKLSRARGWVAPPRGNLTLWVKYETSNAPVMDAMCLWTHLPIPPRPL